MARQKISTNTLVRQFDLPVWEWLRTLPTASVALSSCAAAHNSIAHENHGRYIYWNMASLTFYRYDTWTDSWQQLTPPVATVTASDLEFLGDQGTEGRVLSATSTTFELAGFLPKGFEGYEVRITGGTGSGQRRVITAQAEPVTFDTGVLTAVTAVPSVMTDATKAWAINQWAGYSMRITYGSGMGQVRRILYNDATSLTFLDFNLASFNPHAAPAVTNLGHSATAGSQSNYAIQSSVCTIDSAWAVTPDATSRYKIMTGAVFWVSGLANIAMIYNIGEDLWYYRANSAFNLGVGATENRIEAMPTTLTLSVRSIATAGTTTTLTDSTADWTVNEFVGKWLFIHSGTGEGQIRKISANTQTVLTWVTAGTAPTTTSRYTIEGLDAGTATAGAALTLTDSTQAWTINQWSNMMVSIVAGTGKGQWAIIASNTATALTLVKAWTSPSWYNAAGVAPDATSVYVINNDNSILYMMNQPNAAISRYSLHQGLNFWGNKHDDGVTASAACRYGDFPPITIASVTGTTTHTVTTVYPHGLKTGMTVTMSGDTGAGAGANNIAAVITVTTATAFTYSGSATAWTIVSGLTVTTLKDSTKNWTVNEHAGKMCRFATGLLSSAGALAQLSMEIASNTANTLTFKTATSAPVNGVSLYVITTRNALGAIGHGIATGGSQSGTTLGDSDKILTYTGSVTGSVMTITVAGTAALQVGLVVTGAGITAGSVIMSFGTGTGGTGTYNLSASSAATGSITITSGWVVNAFAGRRLKIIGGTGETAEVTIASNTASVLTTSVITNPVVASTSYVILGHVTRGGGASFDFVHNASRPDMRARHIYSLRGGGVQGMDRFDIVGNGVEQLPNGSIQGPLFNTATQTAYDGKDEIYINQNALQLIYVFNTITGVMTSVNSWPYVVGVGITSNRTVIIETRDHLKYLYINRQNQLEYFRLLLTNLS